MNQAAAFTETVAAPARVLDPSDPMPSARLLVKENYTSGEGLRKIHRHRGTFWAWTGTYYRQVNDEAVRAEVWNFLDQSYVRDDDKLRPFKPKPNNVSDVVEALKAYCRLDDAIEPPTWLSENKLRPEEVFACGNGLLHLPSGKLLPPTPAYFGLTASEVKFDRTAPQPKKWLKFLKDVIGDEAAIRTLQDLFGYLLTPDTTQQKLFMFLGQPRSGKGTTARVLTDLLGRESVTGPSISSLSREFGLTSLITSSLAIVPDARVGAKTDKATVVERLLSISGEDRQTIARKYLSDWNGQLRVRFLILTNELLALADGAGALAKRFIILLFPNSFLGRENPSLTNNLLAELAGILNWSIEGYRRLNKRGHFVQPPNVRDLIGKIEDLGAPVKAFVRDRCVVGPGNEVEVSALFKAYRAWCELKEQKPANENWFGRELHSAVPGVIDRWRRKKGTSKKKDVREHVYVGVALRSQDLERM